MNAFIELGEEHQVILRVLEGVHGMAFNLEHGKPVQAEHLEGLLGFIGTFADRCHHAKEEDLLFPAMARFGVPDENGPLGVMKAEHVDGRALAARMREGLAAFRAGDLAESRALILAPAREYATLLQRHIYKEDNILYPMGRRALPAAVQDELLPRYAEANAKILGPEGKRPFLEFCDALRRAYLPQA
jgi:hemerythrin-like domain-containing protein